MNWRHALDLSSPGLTLTPEDSALLDTLARHVVDLRMDVPAVLFLESIGPLNYLGSQMMLFFAPIVHAFFSGASYDRFQHLLEQRASIQELVTRIEKERRKQQPNS